MIRLGSLNCPHCGQWHRSSKFCDCEGAKAAQAKTYEDALKKMKLKPKPPSAAHHKIRNAMIAVIRKEAAEMDALEVLAIAAYTVGQLIALQDQRTVTPAMAMEIVSSNIEAGNQHVVEGLFGEGAKP